MTIDNVALASGLADLRELAAKKFEADPLPVGQDAQRKLQAEIEKHDLKAEIADLETQGYAVIAPGKAAPMKLFDELRKVIKRIAQTDASANLGPQSGLGHTIFHLLPQDELFEQVVTNEVTLTLVTYLLGFRAKLSQTTGLIKDRKADALGIHADHSNKLPAPWPSIAQYCNVTWVTTDYTRANGAVCVWPGSHRFCRPVPPELRMAHDHEEIEVLEVPKGSVIVWHGSLWHGAVPRTEAGERVTLVLPHVRDHIQAQELFWATATPEMIERNPARLCTLVGLTSAYPWLQDGPSMSRLGMGPVTGSQFE